MCCPAGKGLVRDETRNFGAGGDSAKWRKKREREILNLSLGCLGDAYRVEPEGGCAMQYILYNKLSFPTLHPWHPAARLRRNRSHSGIA